MKNNNHPFVENVENQFGGWQNMISAIDNIQYLLVQLSPGSEVCTQQDIADAHHDLQTLKEEAKKLAKKRPEN